MTPILKENALKSQVSVTARPKFTSISGQRKFRSVLFLIVLNWLMVIRSEVSCLPPVKGGSLDQAKVMGENSTSMNLIEEQNVKSGSNISNSSGIEVRLVELVKNLETGDLGSENSTELHQDKEKVVFPIESLFGNIGKEMMGPATMIDAHHLEMVKKSIMKLVEQKQEIIGLIELAKEELRDENRKISSDLSKVQNSLKSLGTNDSNIPNIKTVEHLIHDMVPVGFIYTQLPFQNPPFIIWPWATWKEITSIYSGKFFRAEGGDSAPFGTAQLDAIRDHKHHFGPRLTSDFVSDDQRVKVRSRESTFLTPNGKTGFIDSSSLDRKYISYSETRPKNFSIKIWIRTADK